MPGQIPQHIYEKLSPEQKAWIRKNTSKLDVAKYRITVCMKCESNRIYQDPRMADAYRDRNKCQEPTPTGLCGGRIRMM